jgi:hypothetical protein
MPIKPENKARYPKDWPAIRAAILERAGHRCEHSDAPGHRCCARHRALGYWREGELWRLPQGFDHLQKRIWRFEPLTHVLRDSGVDRPMTLQTAEGSLKIIRVILTIAHLDHQPENCDPENLRALCQRHHLAHDHDHHRANAQATRRAKSGTGELFA